MKTCSKCGHELNDNMDFCPMCGTPVNGEVENTDSYETEDKGYEEWYSRDIFNVILVPIIRSFDNGTFFLKAATIFIDFIVTTFLLSQPYQAFVCVKDKLLQGLSPSDKATEFIFAIIWLLIAIISFGYWMKRIRLFNRLINANDEFVVIPLGTYLFQWIGEWLALMISIGGIFAIIISMAKVPTSFYVLSLISSYGWTGGILAIIFSVIIVFLFRLYAEKTRALAAIANNTSNRPQVFIDNDENETNDESMFNETFFNILYCSCALFTIVFMLLAM